LGQPSKGFLRFLNDAGISAAARIITEYEGQAAELFRKDQLARALQKVRTVHSGHRAPVPVTKPLRGPNDPFVVGTLGVMSGRKDQSTCGEGAAEGAREIPNARFVTGGDTLPGDTARRDELRKLAFRLGLADRLELAGWIMDPFAFLSRLDVYVQTSRAEG